jgi:hypothetical protein
MPASTSATVDELIARFIGIAGLEPDIAVLEALRMLDEHVDVPDTTAFVEHAAEILIKLADVSRTKASTVSVDVRSDLLDLARELGSREKPKGADALLAAARLRGELAKIWLLEEEGGVCTEAEMGQLLGGLSHQDVAKRHTQGRLLAIDFGKRGTVYPVWQVREGDVLPGLDRVLAELDTFDPWMQLAFFLNPNDWLGEASPLSELRRGHIERVVAAAATYAA